MIPGKQKRRGNPDAFGSVPAAAAPRRAPPEARYRLLLTRLPGTWELIVFDRHRACVLRRIAGPVVEALRATGALPGDLAREGACDADKCLVMHLFLAGAAVAGALEGGPPVQQQAARGGPQQARPPARASSSRASPYVGAAASEWNVSQATPSGSWVHSLSERA